MLFRSPNLHFLENSAALDTSNISRTELAKFGLIPRDQIACFPSNVSESVFSGNSKSNCSMENHHIQFGSLDYGFLNSSLNSAKHENSDHSNSAGIFFGSFSEPVKLDCPLQKVFYNESFFLKLCANQSVTMLEDILDLRQARYSEAEIMEAVNLPILPPSEFIFKFLGRCSRCNLRDHLVSDCPGLCLGCQRLGRKCDIFRPLPSGLRPMKQIWRPKQKQNRRRPSLPVRKIWVPKQRKEREVFPQIRVSEAAASSPPENPPQATVQAPPQRTLAMANFPVNPHAFIPDGMTIERGPADRVVRDRKSVV